MFDLLVLILVLIHIIFPFCRICIKSTTLFCLQCIVYYKLHYKLPCPPASILPDYAK